MKLTLARLPTATIYRHLATYFSFPSAICTQTVYTNNRIVEHERWQKYKVPNTLLGGCKTGSLCDKGSGWLECAADGMHDITHEPMRPSEELENVVKIYKLRAATRLPH